jgi:biopolymer transport protein ExbB/TolQ
MTPVLAEVSDAVAILGAVGTLFTVVVGVLGGWWLKIVAKRVELQRQTKKEDSAEQRKQRRDEITELYRIIELKDKDHTDNRKLIDDVRNDQRDLQSRLLKAEAHQEETDRQLEKCEEDRDELKRRVEALEKRP